MRNLSRTETEIDDFTVCARNDWSESESWYKYPRKVPPSRCCQNGMLRGEYGWVETFLCVVNPT